MSLLVLGTVALDTVKTPHGKRHRILGGSAVHFSMACRLFTPVHLVAVVGHDFPVEHLAFLRRKGIVLDSLMTDSNAETFAWEGEYKGDLNKAITICTKLGVLENFCPLVSEKQKKIRNVFLANVDPGVQLRILESMHNPRLVGLDSMNFYIERSRPALLKVMKKVDIYLANDQEARDLTGESNLIKAARALRSFGPKIVVIKKGEHGVLLHGHNGMALLPAFPTDGVIDPTGAGDTFAGAFMGYLSRCRKITPAALKSALVYGTIAASYNVEGFGLETTASFRLHDIRKRMRIFKSLTAL